LKKCFYLIYLLKEDNYKSIANLCPEKTIISNGLSKWCGAGGWRLGHFIIPNELKKLRKMNYKIVIQG